MSCIHGYENPDYCDDCNAGRRTAELEADCAEWRELAEALIEAGGEDGRYVAIGGRRRWAEAVAAARLKASQSGKPRA